VAGGARRAGPASCALVVGGVEIEPLFDAVGSPGAIAEFYAGATEEDCNRARTQYPELFAGDLWRLPVTCYLLRSGGTTVLVDTGVGPPGLWEDWEPEQEGGLPAALEEHGHTPDDVDLFLLTHVHADHVGWNADAAGEPLFGRYVLHRDALDAARKRAEEGDEIVRRCVLGLGGRLETIAGEVELAPGVATFELPGHDVGHVGLRLGSEAVLIADAIPHSMMLDRPEIVFLYDVDPDAGVATRRTLVAELVDQPVLTVCGHYPGSGIGRAVTRDGRVVWEPA
jgi:glyoxylase-like metal-dependent hydrolase (beta-lactamase superfamily II)